MTVSQLDFFSLHFSIRSLALCYSGTLQDGIITKACINLTMYGKSPREGIFNSTVIRMKAFEHMYWSG